MKRFVLDCSVAMSWCFESESSGKSDKILNMLETHEALVPSLWPLEVANVLVVAERRKRIGESDMYQFIHLLRALPVQVDPNTSEQAFRQILSVARAHKLSSYDAAYLELAMREGLALATFDAQIRRVAKGLKVSLM